MFLSKLIPILVLGRIAVLAQGVTCPYVYPVEITTSNSINGLVFNVEAPGLPYNLRSLQLRPNASQPGTFIAAIDNTSAVFSGNLIDGGLYSQGDNGGTGFLTVVDDFDGTTIWSFGVADGLISPEPTNVDFVLFFAFDDGGYSLLNTIGFIPSTSGTTFGWLICKAGDDLDSGAWYQLFYYSTTIESELNDAFPGCFTVDLIVTLAPTITGFGTCVIGGYTSENISLDAPDT